MSGATDVDSSSMDDGTSVPYASYMSTNSTNTGYSPSYYQQEIIDFFASLKGPLTEYQTAYVMFLMQEYGGATTMVQANNENEMNKYMDEIQQAWNILYSADNKSASGSDLESQFIGQLEAILAQMKQDPFFTNNPQGPSMSASIVSTIKGLEKAVNDCTPPAGMDKLFYLWAQYNPQITGGPTSAQGQTTIMDGVMRQMGQMNQEFTGASQIVQANTQVCAKTWQTEQDTMNNFLKQLNKLISALTQSQRVY